MKLKKKNKIQLAIITSIATVIIELVTFGVMYLTMWLLSFVLEPAYPLWLMSLGTYLGYLLYRRFKTNYKTVEKKAIKQALLKHEYQFFEEEDKKDK